MTTFDQRVLVCGEALVDLLPEGEGAAFRLHPVLGGSPFNVAIGLARLGTATGFLCRLSSDRFGRAQRQRLEQCGVSTRWLQTGPEPTALAMVDPEPAGHGSLDYRFHLQGSAERGLDASAIPAWGVDAVALIHFGSFSLVLPPTADLFADMIRRRAADQLASMDLNIRPAATPDLDAVRDRIDALRSGVDIIKASGEDLRHLFPHEDPLEVCRHWADEGTALVALTCGDHGATLLCGAREVFQSAPGVAVTDTVGAGDSFMAALLDGAMRLNAGDPPGLATIGTAAMENLLARAVRAAAITCSRPGAQPPDRNELESALSAAP